MKNIAALVTAAHQNAVNKGWWNEDRTYGELIAFVHSEGNKALEDYRNMNKTGRALIETWYEYPENMICYEGIDEEREFNGVLGKPCGIPSELADVCIRIFDIAGRYGWGEMLEEYVSQFKLHLEEDWFEIDLKEASFPEKLMRIHQELTLSYIENKVDDGSPVGHLADALYTTYLISKDCGIDLDQAIAEKMAYNATRPARHGGKVI
ncbi:hypothetical protein EBB07_00020 [Paenibacillaceae bacterium]|nr:hypothetical protein EBB07_00020 [Paenibacillaceae bacterium]